MRLLSARLIISLVIGVTLVSLCSSYYQSYMLAQGMRRDLEHRAQLLGESLASNVERDMERSNPGILRRTVQQFANREHLAGLAVYDPQGKTLAVASNLQPLIESGAACPATASSSFALAFELLENGPDVGRRGQEKSSNSVPGGRPTLLPPQSEYGTAPE